jgi:peptidoglycan/xylan/chitin deacetylase (PgdA/CDA1 family)
VSTHVSESDGAPVILMYHRVAAERLDPWRLCVSPRHFEEHLEALRRHAHIVPLRELQRRMVEGTAEPGSVAITFDDGYADNLLAAAPLLARHDAPATVFVTTGYLGGAREFWWDELDRLLLEPGDLPRAVTLELPDGPYRLDLGSAMRAGAEALARRVLRPERASAPASARQSAYRTAWERLLPLRDPEQWRALDALRAATGRPAGPRAARRQLTDGQLAKLAGNGLVEIGAHTVTHPALSLFSVAEQHEEIVGSVAALAARLGAPVHGFSYPHGRYTEDTVRIVREAGLAYACTASPAPRDAPREPDRFALPRVMVTDVDGDGLLRILAEGARVA